MHMHGYPATTGGGSELEEEWQTRLNRQELYEEALRVAHQRALDTTKAIQGDIERLSLRTRGRSQTRSQTHNQSHSRSHSRSRSRSCHRLTATVFPRMALRVDSYGPLPGRRVTFREPVAEPNSERNVEDHTVEPSVSDVEMWMEWQAKQLGTPAWWPELKAILEVKDL